jgi:acylpyruvate hydrolase
MTQNYILKNTRNIIGIGANYFSFIEATKSPKPVEPIVFLKPVSSLIAENEDIQIPKIWKTVNFEAELGVLIGKGGVNIPESEAMGYVGGYCLALDMTGTEYLNVARVSNKPWCLGKAFGTATPVSRFVGAEEIPDVNNLRVWSKLNGEMKQDDTTSGFIFDIPKVISYVSQYMKLEKDDLILTGTPLGAGPVKDGDVIECGLADIVKMEFKVKHQQ